MSIRAQWPFWLIAGFTLLSAQTPLIASGMGCHGGGGGIGPPASFNGRFGFGGPTPAGIIPVTSSFAWEINNATGTAGPTTTPTVSGWSLIQVNYRNGITGNQGNFYWDASSTNKLTFSMMTLLNNTTVGQDTPVGPMANFDTTKTFIWPVVRFPGSYLTQDTTDYPSGAPTLASVLNASTNFDFSGFSNLTTAQLAALNTPGNPYLGWNIQLNNPAGTGSELDLVYSPTPIPEPGTLVLTALGLAGVWRWRRAYAPFARPNNPGGDL